MQGAWDSPLTQKGVMQAEALGKSLLDMHFDRAYVSPQPRALRTARIAITGREIPLIEEPRLAEMRLGAFEGMTFTDAKAMYPETMAHFTDHPALFKPEGEGGETFFSLRDRVDSFLRDVASEGDEHILVLSHALVLLMMRACMLNLPVDQLREGVHVPSACACSAEYRAGVWQVKRFGEAVAE